MDAYPNKLLWLLNAHRLLAGAVFVVVFGVGALVAYLIPTKYTSSMNILIRATPTDLGATPERADRVTVGQVNEAEVNSEVQLLTSYDLVEQTVVKNHLEDASTIPSQEHENVDSAVRKLAGALQVSAIRNTNIIQIQYSDKSPRLAASVLRTIEEGYLQAHVRAQSTPGGYQFFQKQAQYYGKELTDAQQALAKFSRNQNASNLEQQRTLLTQTVSDQRTALQNAEAQIAQLRMEIAKSNRVVDSLSPRIQTTRRSEPNQGAVDHLISLIADLEDRRVKQASTLRDDDPLIEETNAEIAAARKALLNATAIVSYSESTDNNPISQSIQNGREARTVSLAGLESMIAVLRRQLSENAATINHLSDVSGQDALLLSNVQNAQKEFDDYFQRQEASRISEGLDQSKITNVVIAQQPTESVLPVSSHRTLVMVLSFFVAVFAGVAASLIAETLSSSYVFQEAI